MRWLFVMLVALSLSPPTASAAGPAGSASGATAVGGPFQLTNQDGHAVTQASFEGRPLLLYFGYTSCPDVCPVDLAKIVKIADSVRQASGKDVTPVFVTIDPERDTPSRLQAYVRAFGENVVGLTGTTKQIDVITDEYHVYFKKVPVDGGGYLMDHSTVLFLVGPDGAYLDHYGRKLPDEDVVRRIVSTLAASDKASPMNRLPQ
jgi:protein SCO1/2